LAKARLQIKTIRGVQFIDDSYNANPDSTKAALRTMAELETDGRRIAVLGAMAELGAESDSGHKEVGAAAASLGINYLVAVGQNAAEIAAGAEAAGLTNSRLVHDAAEAAELLDEIARPGDLVLVKGSRSARVERVLEEFDHRLVETRSAS
jgi:UDP-N-acetylmuramyl pentapeptide synthase